MEKGSHPGTAGSSSRRMATVSSAASSKGASELPSREEYKGGGAADIFSAALQRLSTSEGSGSLATASAPPFLRRRQPTSDLFDNEDEKAAREEGNSSAARPSSSLSSSSSNSSDGIWGTFTGGEAKLPNCGGDDDDSSIDSAIEGALFVPDPIFDLGALERRAVMPYLPQDQIATGAKVWVVDEEDVATQLQCNYSATYAPVCNGRLSGEVVRHTGRMTMVRFRIPTSDLYLTLCIPTSCLSLDLIEPYDSAPHREDTYTQGCSAYGMIGPRATSHGRLTGAGSEGYVLRCWYEAMPAYDYEKARGTALEKAQAALFSGSFEKALDMVNVYIKKQSGAEQAADTRLSTTMPCQSSSSSRVAPQPATTLVDALILRSRVFIFLERYREALDDAQRCVTLEPHWVRGFLSVARAYGGLGDFGEAAAAIAHASLILPNSSELEGIKEMNNYMFHLQSKLGSAKVVGCYLILDGFYRKRLRIKSTTAAGVALCAEETPITASHSIFSARPPVHHCSVCFRALHPVVRRSSGSCCCSSSSSKDLAQVAVRNATTSTSRNSAVSPPPSSQQGTTEVEDEEEDADCCSVDCAQRASLYRPLEQRYSSALEQVRSLILSKASVTLNVLPLEMAAMTVRLFLMVVTIHRRLMAKRRLDDSNRRNPESAASRGSAEKTASWPDAEERGSRIDMSASGPSTSPVLCVAASLRRLGVYPLCTEPISAHKLDELKIVYEALTSDFKMEDRTTFSCELMSQLFAYVSAYFTPVSLSAPQPLQGEAVTRAGSSQTVFYLPHYVGCIDMAKSISYTTNSSYCCGHASNWIEGEVEGIRRLSGVSRLTLQRPTGASSRSAAVKPCGLGANAPALSTSAVGRSDSSKQEPNCVVQMTTSPAFLELVTMKPVQAGCKLHGMPVEVMLNREEM